ncbi:MAG: DUF4230 domain-containing protein [Microthrixaceae bacterium]
MGRLAKPRNGLGPAATISLAVIAVALVALVGVGLLNVFDPFGTDTVDRSGPAVLERIKELEEFNAAEANFTQDVDIEKDNKVLPDFLKGERVTALVTGTVRATVDFGKLDADAVQVSDDRRTIRLRLPEPELSDADIAEGSTRVVSRERGLIDRVEDVFSGNPFDDSELYRTAEGKLEDAARKSDLLDTAKANTEKWLTTFLQAAGFENVEITWTKPPA